jgi:excisionase family DNA binding protein
LLSESQGQNTMNELAKQTPATRKEFAAWCQASIAYMETNLPADIDGELDDSFHRFAAKLVRLASGHAVRLRLIRLASDLPWVDTKNAKDCICRLQECLKAARRRKRKTKRAAGSALTVEQAAKLMNVAKRTVYDLCKSGQLRHRRLGTGRGTIRIAQADIAALETTAEPTTRRLRHL